MGRIRREQSRAAVKLAGVGSQECGRQTAHRAPPPVPITAAGYVDGELLMNSGHRWRPAGLIHQARIAGVPVGRQGNPRH